VAEVLDRVGERLGVWRLEEQVAEVPSGHWWRATNAASNQAVWLLAYRDAHDAGAVLLRMAASEGEPWQHPDIAWPLDSGLTHSGRPYVVMPLLEGRPLLSQLGAVSLRRRMEWVVQLCELLLVARGQGLSMVELDPSLLWLGPQQQLRLHALAMVRTDAQAQSLGPLSGQISRAAQAFQSPQAQAGAPADAVGQAYSVGTLMGLLVTGRLPGVDATTPDPLSPLSQWLTLRAEARAALDALLHQAIHPEPAQRLPDLQALAEAVEVWLDLSGGMVSGVGGLSTPAALGPAQTPVPPQTPPPPAPFQPTDGLPQTVPFPPRPAPLASPTPGAAGPLKPVAAPELPKAPAPEPTPPRDGLTERERTARKNRWQLLVLGTLALVVAVGLSVTGWLP
jgi:eukaryotic-like serine/threonine-protein kinase